MKFGRCLTRVSPSKSETSLCRRSCIPVNGVPPDPLPPSSKSLENAKGGGGRKLLLFPLSTLPLPGLSATRDFFSKQCRRETLLIIFNNRCFKRFGKFVGDKKKEEKRERGRGKKKNAGTQVERGRKGEAGTKRG